MSGPEPDNPGLIAPGEAPAGLGERVEELLELQRQLFERLADLSDRQGALIDRDDSVGLLELLGQRQRLVDGIAELNATLEPFRARWSAVLASLPEPERDRVNKRLEALSELAGRIAERDEADRIRLQLRRDAVAAELNQISRGRGAVAAYGGGSPPAQFQDRHA